MKQKTNILAKQNNKYVVKVNTKKQLDEFIMLPFDLYNDDEYWVAPLISDTKKHLDTKKNPFFEYAESQYFLAFIDNTVVGRISAHTNPNHNHFHNEKKGFFGFFECIDDQEVADLLFLEAEKWLLEKDCDIISGPFNFTTNDECGLLIDGFASSPFIMMTYNHSYYPNLLENYGFKKEMDMYAWFLESNSMPKFLEKVGLKMEKNSQFSIRCLDKKNLKKDIATVFTIYQKAWERNWGFVPMTKSEFDKLVETLLPIVDNELVLIAEVDGKPAGFSVALPDYNIILKKIRGKINPITLIKIMLQKKKISSARIITMGVVHEFQGIGIDSLFYYYTWKFCLSKGINKGEFSWVLETNTMMNKIAKHLGASIHKTYRIYDKKIHGTDTHIKGKLD